MADHAPTTDTQARADLIAQLDHSGIPQAVQHTHQRDEVVSEFAGNPQAMASAILQLRASLALARAAHADLLRKEGEFGGMSCQPDLPADADDADRIARTVCNAISVVFVGFTQERRRGLESQAAGYIRAALARSRTAPDKPATPPAVTRATCEDACEAARLNGVSMSMEQASAILCSALSVDHAPDAPHPCAHLLGSCAGCCGEGVCGLPPILVDGGSQG
nr:hypothetical protein [uncultured Azospirillum sp.]